MSEANEHPRWQQILDTYLAIQNEGASSEERRSRPVICLADACQRIAELETENHTGADQVDSLQQKLDECVVASGSGCLWAHLPNDIKKMRAEVERLRERESECKRALPKWCQGPGLVGAILHMAEQQALLEAEVERLRDLVKCAITNLENTHLHLTASRLREELAKDGSSDD